MQHDALVGISDPQDAAHLGRCERASIARHPMTLDDDMAGAPHIV